MPEDYVSYINELSPFESADKKRAVMTAHLRGLLGQMETLMLWKDAKEEYKKYYDRIFSNPSIASEFEKVHTRLEKILSDPQTVDQAGYDEVYKLWQPINKQIGN